MNRSFNSRNASVLEYRPFRWEDLPQLKILQSHLFPVQYFDNFYKRLLSSSYVSILLWQKINNIQSSSSSSTITTLDNNSNNIINSDNNINNNNGNNNNNNNNSNSDNINNNNDLFIEFKETNQIEKSFIINKNSEKFDKKNYELIGVATGRISKDDSICGSLFRDRYEGYLMTFGIKESHRSRGMGTDLLNNISKIFKKRGCERIHLHVKKGNNTAYSFYLKNGFKFNQEISNYYKIDNIHYNAMSMTKDLRPKEKKSNWKKFLSLLRQPDYIDLDDIDDNIDIDENGIINANSVSNNSNYPYSLLNKRFNFILLITLILFLFIMLFLISKNENNNNINNNNNKNNNNNNNIDNNQQILNNQYQ